MTSNVQFTHQFNTTDLTQFKNGRSAVLQLPIDVLNLIGEFVSTSNHPAQAAKNAVLFGRVCVLFHRLSHNQNMVTIINFGKSKFEEFKTIFTLQLKYEKLSFENELQVMRGPNGFSGTYNDAYQKRQIALKEYDDALASISPEFREQVAPLTICDFKYYFLLLPFEGKDVVGKYREFHLKDEEFKEIANRFTWIAQFQPGTDRIVGGRLAEISSNLENIHSVTWQEINRMAPNVSPEQETNGAEGA